MDFVPGKCGPTVFRHSSRDLRCVVQDDDLRFPKPPEVEVSVGPGARDASEMDILNRQLAWVDVCVAGSADQMHVRWIAEGVGLADE